MPNLRDEIFLVQKNIIRDLAAKSSCIVVGRCGGSILADMPNRLGVYVYAPYSQRLQNCTQKLGMDEATARRMIRKWTAPGSSITGATAPKSKTSLPTTT